MTSTPGADANPNGEPREQAGAGTTPAPESMTVLVYSDDQNTRRQVKMAIGRRPAADLPRVRIVECATAPAVVKALDAGGIDVAVLDGEAAPAGGMGVCRQMKEEIYHCPPVLVLVGRVDDNWLAAWSLADASVAFPLDPRLVADAVARLLRRRLGVLATR